MKRSITTLAIALVFLSACGKYNEKENMAQNMTEDQALSVLNGEDESTESRSGILGSKKVKKPAVPVKYAEILKLVTDMAASGKITIPGTNGQPFNPSDINQLAAIVSALSGGKTNSTFALVLTLLSQVQSSGGKIDINTVIKLLTAAAPIIAQVAPQYAPVVQAMLVILPIVQALINSSNVPHAALNLRWAQSIA